MKVNFKTLKNNINSIKNIQTIFHIYLHVFEILGSETYTGWRMFEGPYHAKLNNNESIPAMIMTLNMYGISLRELALFKYLTEYKEYVIRGMQRTAPFNRNMKKEIKSLIDKVESGII